MIGMSEKTSIPIILRQYEKLVSFHYDPSSFETIADTIEFTDECVAQNVNAYHLEGWKSFRDRLNSVRNFFNESKIIMRQLDEERKENIKEAIKREEKENANQ